MPDHVQTEFREHETAPRTDEPFTVVRSDDGRWYKVTGACPTCRSAVVFRVAYGVLGPPKRRLRHGARPAPLTGAITVYCQCGYPHPDRPPESPDTGCGAFWDVTVPPEQGSAP